MSSVSADIRQGLRASVPVVIGAGPFGLLFGALAVENGMDVSQAVLMSAVLYAGASQMVGIDLFGAKVAPWLIVLSIFAVNFRHILYSASIGPKIAHYSTFQKAIAFFFLIDPAYVETEKRQEQGQPISFVWFLAMSIPIYLAWVAEAVLGAMFGRLIPDPHAFGIDFLLPVYFLGLVIGFRKRRNWLPVVLASGSASIAVYFTIGSPWHVSIGAIAGVAFAALIAGPSKDLQGPDAVTEQV